jgi:hypothetical protein
MIDEYTYVGGDEEHHCRFGEDRLRQRYISTFAVKGLKPLHVRECGYQAKQSSLP